MENIIVYSSGEVRWRGKVYRAALGKNGVSSEMREGKVWLSLYNLYDNLGLVLYNAVYNST